MITHPFFFRKQLSAITINNIYLLIRQNTHKIDIMESGDKFYESINWNK